MHHRAEVGPGDTVHLAVAPGKAHVFDGKSGQRL
jgi:peptidyl-tRNA hydrolase